MKLLHFIFIFLVFAGCSDDDCANEDMAIDFDMKIRLLSETTGENLLDVMDFDVNNLRFVDVATGISSPIEGIATNNLGQRVIVYAPINQRNLRIEYNGVQLKNIVISDVVSSVENCNVKVQSYTISSENMMLCTCTIEDTFTLQIPF